MERKGRTCKSNPHTLPEPHGAAITTIAAAAAVVVTAAHGAPRQVNELLLATDAPHALSIARKHKRRRLSERPEIGEEQPQQAQQLPSMPVLIDVESFLPEHQSHNHKSKKAKKSKKNARRDKFSQRHHSCHSKPKEFEQEPDQEHQYQCHDEEGERNDLMQENEQVGNVTILEQLLTDKPKHHRHHHRRHRLDRNTQPQHPQNQYHRHCRQDRRHQTTSDVPSSTSTVSVASSHGSSTSTSAVRPRHWFGQKKCILEQWRREEHSQQQQMRGDSDS